MSIQQHFYMLGNAFGLIRGAMVTDSTTTSLTEGTETVISWDTEVNDWGRYFDAGTPTKFTVPVDSPGWHVMSYNVTHNLGTATWYSNAYMQGPPGDFLNAFVPYERPVTTTFNQNRSIGMVSKGAVTDQMQAVSNWYSGSGSRTIAAGAKFNIGKIWASTVVGSIAVRNATASIATVAETTVTFDTELIDDGAMIDLGAQPTRITIPSSGWYILIMTSRWASTATFSDRRAFIRKNAATPYVGVNYIITGMTSGATSCPAYAIAYLAAADYLEVRVRHSEGGNRTLNSASLTAAKVDTPDTIGARVSYAGSAQTINTGSDVLITFDTEEHDDDAMVDLGSQPGRITCTESGLYAISGHVGTALNTGVVMTINLKVNASTVIGSVSIECFGTTANVFAVHYLTAGDYVSLHVNPAANTTSTTGDNRPTLAMVLLAKGQAAPPGASPGALSGTAALAFDATATATATTTEVLTTASVSPWTAPTGVTSVQVQMWGGGGRGSTRTTNGAGGGGGGGGYSKLNSYTVVPGNTYAFQVGLGSTAGTSGPTNATWWIDTATGWARPGGSVANDTATGGAASLTGVGDVQAAGGVGVTGSTTGGGGGEAGGASGNGATGSGQTGGTGVNADGGDGGDGGPAASGPGSAGSVPGGGGGGAFRSGGATRAGGSGGAGRIILTY